MTKSIQEEFDAYAAEMRANLSEFRSKLTGNKEEDEKLSEAYGFPLFEEGTEKYGNPSYDDEYGDGHKRYLRWHYTPQKMIEAEEKFNQHKDEEYKKARESRNQKAIQEYYQHQWPKSVNNQFHSLMDELGIDPYSVYGDLETDWNSVPVQRYVPGWHSSTVGC